ncbi:hypothetical protein LTS08_006498 [Lithohypha guttulata]|nr:hypothetical protein LTS08_006498 [Lithohypha guttulata]
MLALATVLLGFGLSALAQNSTTSIFLPIIEAQTLVASLSQQNGDIKTLVIKCPDGTDSTKCGFPTPVTVTAGPSTLALTTTVASTMIVDLKCGVKGSSEASCTQIYTGPASLYTTGDNIDGSKTTTWTASQSLSSGKVTHLPVTITAGLPSSTSKGNAGAVPTAGLGQMLAAGVFANIAAVII